MRVPIGGCSCHPGINLTSRAPNVTAAPPRAVRAAATKHPGGERSSRTRTIAACVRAGESAGAQSPVQIDDTATAPRVGRADPLTYRRRLPSCRAAEGMIEQPRANRASDDQAPRGVSTSTSTTARSEMR